MERGNMSVRRARSSRRRFRGQPWTRHAAKLPDKIGWLSVVQMKAFRTGLVGTLGVGLGILIWGAISSLSTVLSYIGISLFIALGLDPVIRWLERKRLPRPAAVAVVLVGLLAVTAGVLFLVIPRIIEQTRNLIEQAPTMVHQLSASGWVQHIQQLLGGLVDVNALVRSAGTFLSDPTNLVAIGGGLLAVGQGLAGGVTGLLIIIVLTLYFIVSMRGMKRALYQLVPASRRKKFAEVTEDISAAVSSYVIGQLILAALNGILSAIVLTTVGAPIPLLLSLLAFLGALVPLVGTVVSAIIITLVCVVASPQTALIVGIYYLIYMQVEAYILTPRIMNQTVSVPGALVVIAAITGGTLAGILGALVAIPLAASALIIIRKILIPRQNTR